MLVTMPVFVSTCASVCVPAFTCVCVLSVYDVIIMFLVYGICLFRLR